jgi:transposase
MAKAKEIDIKESVKDLKSILKKQPDHLRNRIRMLVLIKESEEPLSKNALADIVGVNHNSIQSWRKLYETGGISKLLEYKRGGYKPAMIRGKILKKVEERLNDADNAFRSYAELRQWIDDNFIPGINYHTVNKFVKRKFGAKLKVTRKSHIDKDEQAVEAFKKTSDHSKRRNRK